MPFPNEHACRVRDPDQFARFRRDNDKDPNEIWGIREDESQALQSYRYPTSRWSESEAREHCTSHEGDFEPADPDSEENDSNDNGNDDDGAASQNVPALDLSVLSGVRVPNFSQYFGIWAHEPDRFVALYTQITQMDLRQHVKVASVERDAAGPRTRGVGDGEQKIAVINLTGTLTKKPASLSDDTSTVEARNQIRAARRSQEIKGILLFVDSPGGTVAGTPDLAEEVAAAAAEMPVTAFVEDLVASAAYWVASQADRIVANHKTAFVGSIGAFMGLYDLSARAGQLGMKPVLITSGGVKGMGFPGTEITEAHKTMLQGLVNETQAEFNKAVARGRAMSQAQVEKLADGALHTADTALDLNLVDAIQSFDETVAELKTAVRRGSGSQQASSDSGDTTMPDKTNDQPQPVTVAQLKEHFPSNTAEDREHCLEQGMTLEQAGPYMANALAARLQNREQELEQASVKKPGNQAVGEDTPPSGGDQFEDPRAEFQEKVEQKVAKGMSRDRAVMRVNRENPELRQAVVEQANATAA